MALRIAFDLDGVLADMETELVRQAEVVFGESITRRQDDDAGSSDDAEPAREAGPGDSADGMQKAAEAAADNTPPLVRLKLTGRQQRRLWRHVESIENFWESLVETEPGIVARVASLAAERRWEIIFLTKRPQTAGSTAQVQTQRWLEANGFRMPSVFVVQGSRGLIAASLDLDFVIDDRPENCVDVVADSRARAILVWRDDETQLPVVAKRLGIGIVKSVDECLAILTKVDSGEPESVGLIDRFKRLIAGRQS